MRGARVAAKDARKREGISDPADVLALLAGEGSAVTTVRSYASAFATFRPWFEDRYAQDPTLGAATHTTCDLRS